MFVILSWTFGPITGAMPTPPPDVVSLKSREAGWAITIFEFDFTQDCFSIIF
jgi:hypothetical protein